MASTAFARARRFLNYHASARWAALTAGAATAVLYVSFLFLLALFADLLVNQGEIPTYSHLSSQHRPPVDKQELEALADTPTVWSRRLVELGLVAADSRDRHERDALVALVAAGVKEQNLTPRKKEQRLELYWRWWVRSYLTDHVGEAAALHVAEKTRNLAQRSGVDLALARDIPDAGILSLTVRVHGRLDAWFAGWVAALNPWTWESGTLVYLLWLLIVGILLALVRAGLMFLNKYLAAQATTEAVTRLRRAVYHHTYRLGTLAFRALGPTEAVGVFTRHLEAVNDGLFLWLTAFFREPIKFALLLLFALMVNVWVTVAFVLFALLVWIFGGQLAAFFRRLGRRESEQAAEQLALLQESLMMMRLVKVYLMELFNQTRVERLLSRAADAQLRKLRGEALYRPLLVFFGMLATLILSFLLGVIVTSGQLSVTGAIVLTTALVSLYHPVQHWLDTRRFVRRGKESAVVIFEFLDRKGDVGQRVEAEFLPPLADKLEFERVSLKEPGTGRTLLRNVNLTIQAGQRVAIVGSQEMEKHALVYLIPRFLDPTSGEIRIDNKSLPWVTLDSLRAQIAIVLQHNLVFNDTVANNISCGDKSYTLPQLIEVAKSAHAHQFIQKLPRGYETPIGEMGHSLNIGQRFRIALARAILRDPALLIIEEPLVPMDEEVKDLLDDTMARVLPGRTVIFLPHRLSTIRHCDRVFLLHEGEIVAAGEHKELVSQNELYRHLQYLEFNEFAGIVERPIAGGLL